MAIFTDLPLLPRPAPDFFAEQAGRAVMAAVASGNLNITNN
jgi:hypothetical protein